MRGNWLLLQCLVKALDVFLQWCHFLIYGHWQKGVTKNGRPFHIINDETLELTENPHSMMKLWN